MSGIWYSLPLTSLGRMHFLRGNEGELQWMYISLGHHGPSPLRVIFPLNLWHEEKLKPSGVAEIHCSLKVYFKKQQKR